MKTKLWTKEYMVAILTLFGCHMGPYLALSVISIYAKQLTGSDTLAGMMVSVFPLCGIAARFLSAGLLDRFRCKKIVLFSVSGMVAATLGYLFFNSYWLAFGLRGLLGFCYSIAVTAISTYVVKLLHPDLLLEGIGYSALTNSLCGVVGPSLAFALIGPNQNHFPLLFLVIFGCCAATLLTAFTLRDLQPAAKSEQNQKDSGRINWVSIVLAFLILFICNLTNSALTSFLSLFAAEKEISDIGTYFSVNALGVLFSRFTMKRIVDRLGNSRTIILCVATECVGLLAISQATALWHLLVVAFPMGFAMGALLPIINTHMVNHMPASKSGMANAIFYAAGDLGVIIGATLWGMVSGASSYGNTFMIASLVTITSVTLGVVQMRFNVKGDVNVAH